MRTIVRYLVLTVFLVTATSTAVLLGEAIANRDWSAYASAPTQFPPQPLGNGLIVYVDPGTFCEYIRPSGASSAPLTPRVSADGRRHYGCGISPEMERR